MTTPVFDTLIRGADVVTPGGVRPLDVGLAAGRIVALAPTLTESAAHTIEAGGQLLVPGMIDAHVHFNEPGRTEWEGFATGSHAAAAGGVTTVFDMPLNSSPATLTAEDFAAKQALAAAKSRVNVRLWGGLVPGNEAHLAVLHACGVIGFKAFMSASGIDEFPRVDEPTLHAGMKIIAGLPGMRLALHAEDERLTVRLAAEARAAGRTDARAFVESRPVEAELAAIRLALGLSEETGCPLHIVHVSSAEGLAELAAAKQRGLNVSAETCPHYLFLTADDMVAIGPRAKCAPPLRDEANRQQLWAALARGEVDTIGSDHSPCPPEMKVAANFFSAWGGISGVQHSLPLLYAEAEARNIPNEKIASLLSAAPARIFGLGGDIGHIAVGASADLCLLARRSEYFVLREELRDRHKHSPYVGRSMPLAVARTLVAGNTVFEKM
jgi:allantoinase